MTTEKTGGFAPSRRTLVKGAAWSVPVVAMGAPAMAVVCSPNNTSPECNPVPPPVSQPGNACKHPGNSCGSSLRAAYHFVFCLSNSSGQDITVYFPSMSVDGQSKAPSPSSVVVPAGSPSTCVTLHITDMGNSENGNGTLTYSYTWVNEFDEVIPVSGSVSTGVNNLPPCPSCDGGTASSRESATDEQATTDEAKASRQGFAEIEVPNLIGQDVADAGVSVAAAGLTLKTGAIAGRVISQTPEAGTLVARSAVVEVEVELTQRGVATPEPEPVETAPSDDAAPVEEAPAASEGDE